MSCWGSKYILTTREESLGELLLEFFRYFGYAPRKETRAGQCNWKYVEFLVYSNGPESKLLLAGAEADTNLDPCDN